MAKVITASTSGACPIQTQVWLLSTESLKQAATSTQHHWIFEFSPTIRHCGWCNSVSHVRKRSLKGKWHVKDTLCASAHVGAQLKAQAIKAQRCLPSPGLSRVCSLSAFPCKRQGHSLQRWLTLLEPGSQESCEPCVLFSNSIKCLTRNFKCLHYCWHTEILRIQFGVFQK